ncbi:MAG: hypothetical protein JO257_31310 [Deltaproteobacteria bacterium]|nr:hypothetical protein [Deltaproteobacteria bacterium]
MQRALALGLLLGGSATARADVTVGVQLTPDGQMLAHQLGVTPDQLASKLHDRVESVMGTDGGSLQRFSDAAVLSSHGLGVDYVSVPESLIVGVAANAASANGDVPSSIGGGLAANVALMAGMNLSPWHLPRWTIYGSGFYRSETIKDVTGHITNAGAHLQYALIPASEGGGVARWTGVQLTTGLELTRWTLGTTRAMSTAFTVMGSQGSAKLGYDSTGSLELGSTSVDVPVELSTGIRLAVVSFYTGVGLDLTQGQGTIDAHLSGPLHDADGRMLGTVTIDGHDSRGASPFTPRAFTGVQLDAWKLKVFGHVNATADSAASVGIGVRGVL